MIIPFKWYYYDEIEEDCQISDALGMHETDVTWDMHEAFSSVAGEITLDCTYNTVTNEIAILHMNKTG